MEETVTKQIQIAGDVYVVVIGKEGNCIRVVPRGFRQGFWDVWREVGVEFIIGWIEYERSWKGLLNGDYQTDGRWEIDDEHLEACMYCTWRVDSFIPREKRRPYTLGLTRQAGNWFLFHGIRAIWSPACPVVGASSLQGTAPQKQTPAVSLKDGFLFFFSLT